MSFYCEWSVHGAPLKLKLNVIFEYSGFSKMFNTIFILMLYQWTPFCTEKLFGGRREDRKWRDCERRYIFKGETEKITIFEIFQSVLSPFW